jgi:PBP1b-binding outer membrane lipoprotein LpoB
VSKYPTIYYEDFVDLGANDNALIDILKLSFDTYKPTNVTTIPTPYVESNVEDRILNKFDWNKDKERILNELQ